MWKDPFSAQGNYFYESTYRASASILHFAALGPSFGHSIAPKSRPKAAASAVASGSAPVLDHLNLNHEKGRHDLVKAFYFDALGMAADPRKAENL